MRALMDRDDTLAQEVINLDGQVNAYDVEVDDRCVELLALNQPAAADLRFITTAMKIVTDLERIGDQAVNIAQRVLELNQQPQLKPYIDLPRMAESASVWSRRAWTPSWRATQSWRGGCAQRTTQWTDSEIRSFGSC
jgi:phosphate transport system protein